MITSWQLCDDSLGSLSLLRLADESYKFVMLLVIEMCQNKAMLLRNIGYKFVKIVLQLKKLPQASHNAVWLQFNMYV